jgi:hypothetical protein
MSMAEIARRTETSAEEVLALVGVDSGGMEGGNFWVMVEDFEGDPTLETVVVRTDRLPKEAMLPKKQFPDFIT